MKRWIFSTAFLLCASLVFVACNDDDDDDDDQIFSSDDVANTLTVAGDWVVDYYLDDDGDDETDDFVGYVFRFEENGTLVVTKGNATEVGTWRVTADGRRLIFDIDDDNDALDELDDIDEDWRIIEKTDRLIKLREYDDDDDDDDDDKLHFRAL